MQSFRTEQGAKFALNCHRQEKERSMAIAILKPGTYIDKFGRRFTATPEMLSEVASAYRPSSHMAALTKGHPESDAEPAYGWVGSLRYEGDTLIGEPIKVDPTFREAVNDAHFPFVSPSFYWPDDPANPTPGKWHLRHVAFLGAVPPAAKGQGMVHLSEGEPALELREFTKEERDKLAKSGVAMKDGSYPIENAQDLRNAVGDYYRTGKDPAVKAHIMKRARALGLEKELPDDWKGTSLSEGGTMEKLTEVMTALLDRLKGHNGVPPQLSEGEHMGKDEEAALAAKQKELEDQKNALAQKALELSEREKRIAAAEEKARKANALEFAESLAKSGQILPREVAPLAEVLANVAYETPLEFSEGDKKVQTTPKAVLEPILKRLGKAVELGELAGGPIPGAGRVSRTPIPKGYQVDPKELELHAKALAFAEKNHVDYVTAIQAVEEDER
jgi:hypothetical protein